MNWAKKIDFKVSLPKNATQKFKIIDYSRENALNKSMHDLGVLEQFYISQFYYFGNGQLGIPVLNDEIRARLFEKLAPYFSDVKMVEHTEYREILLYNLIDIAFEAYRKMEGEKSINPIISCLYTGEKFVFSPTQNLGVYLLNSELVEGKSVDSFDETLALLESIYLERGNIPIKLLGWDFNDDLMKKDSIRYFVSKGFDVNIYVDEITKKCFYMELIIR